MKKQILVEYEKFTHWTELNDARQSAIRQAQTAMNKAYAPYSKFSVGACVVLDNGAVICGNNQENIAYPSGMCAERVALFYANATHPTSNVNTLVIVAQGNLVKPDMCISPCGSCRQVIAESESRQKEPITIILVAQNGETWIFHSINDLLIFPFGVSDKNE